MGSVTAIRGSLDAGGAGTYRTGRRPSLHSVLNDRRTTRPALSGVRRGSLTSRRRRSLASAAARRLTDSLVSPEVMQGSLLSVGQYRITSGDLNILQNNYRVKVSDALSHRGVFQKNFNG